MPSITTLRVEIFIFLIQYQLYIELNKKGSPPYGVVKTRGENTFIFLIFFFFLIIHPLFSTQKQNKKKTKTSCHVQIKMRTSLYNIGNIKSRLFFFSSLISRIFNFLIVFFFFLLVTLLFNFPSINLSNLIKSA